MNRLKVYFDGGSKPARVNGRYQWVGYGSYEVVGDTVLQRVEREQFGVMTSNQAEYAALIKALEYCVATHPGLPVDIFTDSKLVEGHLIGSYRVKKEHLKPMVERCKVLLDQMSGWVIEWRRRHHNVKRFGH